MGGEVGDPLVWLKVLGLGNEDARKYIKLCPGQYLQSSDQKGFFNKGKDTICKDGGNAIGT